MSKHLARDSSLWNRLIYGDSRYQLPVGNLSKSKTESPAKSPESIPKSHNLVNSIMKKSLAAFVLLLSVALCLNYIGNRDFHLKGFGVNGVNRRPGLFSPDNRVLISATDHGSSDHEIIEVSYPFVPNSRYGKPVHHELLINATFDSWGNPAYVQYQPPKNVTFNRVVLTLHTNVSHVQYDRLAHFFIGGAEVWRTSTIEPSGGTVYSVFSKDLSGYLSLFSEPNDLLFQLDNTVTPDLQGKPHIELYADFYNESNETALFGQVPVSDGSTDDRYSIFDIRRPADHAYALIKESDKKTPPTENLPSANITVSLPQVPRNTTRLKLAVMTSGNGDEEFWYTNVLDKYTEVFKSSGNTFLGHGPLRILNVYLNGQKIAAQTQQPFIFTGGISPSLWDPVVSSHAFDLSSIDIDVSGLLPLLWESGHHKLTFDVSNAVDEFESQSSGIGSDWITAVNLLTFENSQVAQASGKISHIGQRTRGNTFGVAPPHTGTLHQVVNGILEAELTSELVFELKNGNSLNTTVSSFTKGEISNVQQYTNSGSNNKIVHVGHSAKSFLLLDNSDNSEIHRTNISRYPLVLLQKVTSVSGGSDNEIDIVYLRSTTLDINKSRVMAEISTQNGTSVFHQRNTGNYGTGSLDTKYKIQVSGPLLEYEYTRLVKGVNGEITHDDDHFEPSVSDWSAIDREIAQVSNTNSTIYLGVPLI